MNCQETVGYSVLYYRYWSTPVGCTDKGSQLNYNKYHASSIYVSSSLSDCTVSAGPYQTRWLTFDLSCVNYRARILRDIRQSQMFKKITIHDKYTWQQMENS